MAENSNPNMSLYIRFKAVEDKACKEFNNGKFKGTDINPQWRIRRMTEEFGPIGIGWYEEVVEKWTQEYNGKVACFIKVHLSIKDKDTKEWSKPIVGIGGNMISTGSIKNGFSISDEAFKMALTDAEGNAMKRLGLAADVYFDKDVRWESKYEQYEQSTDGAQQPDARKGGKKAQASIHQPAQQPAQPDGYDMGLLMSACEELNKAVNVSILQNVWYKYPQFSQDENFRTSYMRREQQLKSQQ